MIFEGRPHSNTPPVVTIGSPAADSVEVTVGDSLAFAATALDLEAGDLSAALTWTSSLAGAIGSGPPSPPPRSASAPTSSPLPPPTATAGRPGCGHRGRPHPAGHHHLELDRRRRRLPARKHRKQRGRQLRGRHPVADRRRQQRPPVPQPAFLRHRGPARQRDRQDRQGAGAPLQPDQHQSPSPPTAAAWSTSNPASSAPPATSRTSTSKPRPTPSAPPS